MKKLKLSMLGLATAAALTLRASAGILSYDAIPATDSDAGSGISTEQTFTSAVAASSTDCTVGGVTLYSLTPNGNTASANDITVDTSAGTLANGDNDASAIHADGAMQEVFSHVLTNTGATDGSQEEIAIDPGGLTKGKTYTLRVYIAPGASDSDREVNLSFAGDGGEAVETGTFNEDDATTCPEPFQDASQAYSIAYKFTWDGKTQPGVIVTQNNGNAPFRLFAVTNQQGESDLVASAPSSKGKDVGVKSDVFYSSDDLNSHGDWVKVGDYGACWHPTDVDDSWQPYTRGSWAYDDAGGWTWVSNEPWGWATYHYGRWMRVADTGWCWVPGRVWAPSWVSWRQSDDYVGWAPLPPDADCGEDVAITDDADEDYDIGPDAYEFCAIADLSAAVLTDVLLAHERNVDLIEHTTNITNISINATSHMLVAGGPAFAMVNRAILRGGGVPVPRVHLDRRGSLAGRESIRDGRLAIRAPFIAAGGHARVPAHMRVVNAAKIDKGWSGIKNPAVRAELKRTVAVQSRHAAVGAGLKFGIGKPVGQSPHGFSATPARVHPHVGGLVSNNNSRNTSTHIVQGPNHRGNTGTANGENHGENRGIARQTQPTREPRENGNSGETTVSRKSRNTQQTTDDNSGIARRKENNSDDETPRTTQRKRSVPSNNENAEVTPARPRRTVDQQQTANREPVTPRPQVQRSYTQPEQQRSYVQPQRVEPQPVRPMPVQNTFVPRPQPVFTPQTNFNPYKKNTLY